MTIIGSESQKANPALQPLARLIGEWKTTGTHPMVPGKTFHGRTSFAWIEGGAFMVVRSEIDEPEIPSATAIFGSDDAEGTLTLTYFDERGVSRKYAVTAEGDEIAWHRDDPKFKQRMTLTIDPDGRKMVAKGRMSRDGKPWEDDLELAYERK